MSQSALLVPKIPKSVVTWKPHMEIRKTDKHYTNCGQDNHNV